MKRIWIWNHDATRMFSDRAGRHYWFAMRLKERGYSPAVFCANINHFTGETRILGNLYEIAKVDDIPFVFVKTTPYQGNGLDRIKNWYSFYRNLFRVYKSVIERLGRPDILLASSVHPLTMVAGVQIARKIKVPCICEVRDLWPEAIFNVGKAKENSLMGKVLRSGEYWIYRNADAMIFTKEGDTDYLREQHWLLEQGGKIDINKCHYINNGIDYKRYREQIEEKVLADADLEAEKFHVVYTGTLRKVNNIENIIDAAIILREYEDIDFLIFGEGVLRQEMEKVVRDNGLTNVKFKGYVNRQYIPYILSRSSVNLLNYAQDLYNWKRGNSSNKMFEYLASGKPIISTVKMGYDILERYQCGITLEECTAECLAEKILYVRDLSAEKYREMGIRAQEAAQEFDFDKLTDKLEKVIAFVSGEKDE
ncbi:MAG: glycosyltransferase family 4 protein [Acetatifactor sp.]|nr:glycosyltransferase family 4 protein [Acetatifactor sp.]